MAVAKHAEQRNAGRTEMAYTDRLVKSTKYHLLV